MTFQPLTFDPGRAGARRRGPVTEGNVVQRFGLALVHIGISDIETIDCCGFIWQIDIYYS